MTELSLTRMCHGQTKGIRRSWSKARLTEPVRSQYKAITGVNKEAFILKKVYKEFYCNSLQYHTQGQKK